MNVFLLQLYFSDTLSIFTGRCSRYNASGRRIKGRHITENHCIKQEYDNGLF